MSSKPNSTARVVRSVDPLAPPDGSPGEDPLPEPDAPTRPAHRRRSGEPFPHRAEYLFAQRLLSLNLRLAPLVAAAMSAGAITLAVLTAQARDSWLPPALWCAFVIAVAIPAAILGLRHGRAPAGAELWGVSVARRKGGLLLGTSALLGLMAADLATASVAPAMFTVLLAVCVVALAGIAARPVRFALMTVLVLVPFAWRMAHAAPEVTLAALVLIGVLLPVHALLSLILASAVRSDAEQRARLDRLAFTNEALFADRQALHTESRTDALTALANRRQLEESLRNEWSRCGRSRSPLSCVMLDVDHFKAYNDHYGHDGGDDCLRAVAALLATTTSRRPGDLVARHGGEEFVLLLPETGSGGAATVADLVKRALAGHNLPHAASPTAPRVTVSMGVASMVPDADRIPEELLKAADLALYEAKRNGRNCVVMADEQTLESARLAARGMIG